MDGAPSISVWPDVIDLAGPLRREVLVAGAKQKALPDAVDRHGAAAHTKRGRDQAPEREQQLSSGDPVSDHAEARKTENDDNSQAEPDGGRRDPGRAQ
jgi:hypothetical protein